MKNRNILLLLVVTMGMVVGAIVRDGRAAPEAALDPKALDAVKTMSEYMAGLESFQFRTDETAEGVVMIKETRLKIQCASHRKVAVKQPGLMSIDVGGDLTQRKLWLQKGEFTLLDEEAKQWTTTSLDSESGDLLRALRDKMGMIIPLATLVSQDLHAKIREQADFAVYLGRHVVGQDSCHHVLFRAHGYVWQLWIAAGERPLPLKFVVTNLAEAEQPQQVVRLLDWKINPRLRKSLFTPQIPGVAEEVDTLPLVFWVPAVDGAADQP